MDWECITYKDSTNYSYEYYYSKRELGVGDGHKKQSGRKKETQMHNFLIFLRWVCHLGANRHAGDRENTICGLIKARVRKLLCL